MTPGERRRRSAKRRKLGRTRAARTAARDARRPPPRTHIRGRDVRVTFHVDGQEITLANAVGASIENISAFHGIDRSVEPERLSGYTLGFTAVDTGSGPLYFTTDHSSSWDSLWSAIATAGAMSPAFHAMRDEIDERDREALREQLNGYPHESEDDRVDALMYGLQMAGVQPLPPRHAMSQAIGRISASRRYFIDDPDRRSLFARCGSLRAVLNDELTTPDGFPFTAPQ